MGGYAKFWTDMLSDQWFVKQPIIGRGIWMQLILIAKQQGDTGVVCYRSAYALGIACACDANSVRKYLRNFRDEQRIELSEEKNCLTIKICNYHKWQELNAKEHVKSRVSVAEKSTENPSLPHQITPEKTILKKSCAATNPAHQRIIDYFCQEYQTRTGVPYAFQGGKDGKLIKAMLRTWTEDQMQKLIRQLFKTTDDFIAKTDRGVSVLSACQNKLAQECRESAKLQLEADAWQKQLAANHPP